MILANLLDRELLGKGYAGQTWWTCREKLLEFKQSPLFDQVDLFVICHTEPNRVIGNIPHFQFMDDKDAGMRDFRRHYMDLIYNKDFNEWCAKNWMQELNHILQDKKVIHIPGFENLFPFLSLLDGFVIKPSLTEISLQEPGYNDREKLNYDARANHLSKENNQWLAHELYKICTDATSIDDKLDKRTLWLNNNKSK